MTTLIPHSTSPRGTRFVVTNTTSFLKAGVFDAQNLVTITLAKLIEKLGVLTHDELTRAEDVTRHWLGL